jgi:hypothetical protein
MGVAVVAFRAATRVDQSPVCPEGEAAFASR